jgi:hypothetical protein
MRLRVVLSRCWQWSSVEFSEEVFLDRLSRMYATVVRVPLLGNLAGSHV